MPVTSRRLFARKLGVGVGAALVARPGLSSPVARDPGPIRLSSNENPYGPSATAREAMTQSQEIAALYLWRRQNGHLQRRVTSSFRRYLEVASLPEVQDARGDPR